MGGEDDVVARPAGELPPGRGATRYHRLLGLLQVVILLVGLAAAEVGGLAWRSYLRGQAARNFTDTTTTAANTLTVGLQRDADLTAAARTLVETSPRLTNEQFAKWFAVLGARHSYPGTFGLMLIDNVHRADLAAFARRAVKDPPLDLPLPGPYRLTPPGSRSSYCLMRAGEVQLSPSSGMSLSSLSGLLAFTRPDLDYCTMPIATLLHQSADSGSEAVQPLKALIAEAPHEAGVPVVPKVLPTFLAKSGLIVEITPIYRSPAVPSTTGLRRSMLTGWILGIYQADSILDSVLAGRHGVSAALSYVNPNGRRVLLASDGRHGADAVFRTYTLRAAGRWVVSLAGSPQVAGSPATDQGLAVGLGGATVVLLLFGLVRVLSRSRAKALELVAARTAQLRHQALHDGLTDLPNRDLIFDRTEQLLARARRDGTSSAALFVDLDRFKDVNDTCGHDAGDTLLREVGMRFSGVLRETDTVGRLGGDEFVVLVEGAQGAQDPRRVAERLMASLRTPVRLTGGERELTVSASIGIAAGARESAGELLRDADIALYEAKRTARGGYVVFHPEMQTAIATRWGLEADLRSAIRKREFFVVYQPTFSLDDERITGAEALLRWNHPQRGSVLPGEFIPTLEATGMILEVGELVLERACSQAARWVRDGNPLTVSVNVSGRQLDRDDFVATVHDVLSSTGLEPRLLTLEITETTLMRNAELSARRLRSLKQLGVNVAVDDCGTGYCSLAYLQQFPVDALKIDQSFVSRMESSAEGAALVHTIVQMGRDLNIETVAEGIETVAQLERLRRERCSNGQGFLLAHPLEAGAFAELVAASRASSHLRQ
ncbi:MAG: putative bifunctional diguanylate cyclase/phosphodiesterase [Acidimicrobiales bacterium]